MDHGTILTGAWQCRGGANISVFFSLCPSEYQLNNSCADFFFFISRYKKSLPQVMLKVIHQFF
jgi:hypothetical protein